MNTSSANYVWRAGYWTAAQPDWIWIAAHYVWTPSGYLFIPGHWDYELSHRGVLFAPVAFNGAYWAGRPIVYGPSVVIDPGVLTVDFFVRPNYYHYYFGDCYGPAYVGWGFHPWFGVGIGYDPLFTYYRWYNIRRDPGWAVRVSERFVYMDRHPEARPPRTYAMSIRVGAPGGVRIGISSTNMPGDRVRRISKPFRWRSGKSSRMKRCDRTKSLVSGRLPRRHPGGRPGEGRDRSTCMPWRNTAAVICPALNTARWLIESERPVEIERSVESESPVEIEDSRTAAPAARLALAQRPVLELRHFIQPVQHPRRRRSPAPSLVNRHAPAHCRDARLLRLPIPRRSPMSVAAAVVGF